MKGKRGFTLIELMIVVAIIAIIAAIAIPSLLRSRIAANESAAVAGLKQLVSTQATWRQTDSDMNGTQDFWTRNVAGFYAMTDGQGTPLRYIDVNFAKADTSVNQAQMEALLTAGGGTLPRSKSGYLFQVLTGQDNDKDGTLTSYQLNTGWPRVPAIAHGNAFQYAFAAFPEDYGTTGIRTFVVNEEGVIYGADRGVGTPLVTWPGTDPTNERSTTRATSPRWAPN